MFQNCLNHASVAPLLSNKADVRREAQMMQAIIELAGENGLLHAAQQKTIESLRFLLEDLLEPADACAEAAGISIT